MEIIQLNLANDAKAKLVNYEKIARSNYLLLEIRKLLNLKAEFFTKWNQVGGAFNGAFLYDDIQNPLTAIYFHDDKQFFLENHKHLKVGNILVTISNTNNNLDWNKLLNTADNTFDELLKEKGSLLLSQVNRFLITVGCQESKQSPEQLRTLIDNICAEFLNSKTFPMQQTLPSFSEDLGESHDYDVEVIFEKSISENIFVEILKKYLPNFQKPIFGYGYKERNPVPNMDFWINLYARQF